MYPDVRLNFNTNTYDKNRVGFTQQGYHLENFMVQPNDKN